MQPRKSAAEEFDSIDAMSPEDALDAIQDVDVPEPGNALSVKWRVSGQQFVQQNTERKNV